ncbi:MAG: transketolase family protein [Patescibacteria group bacterium]
MPINPKAYLAENIFELNKLEQKPNREGYGLGLAEAGEKNSQIVALCADLTESTRMHYFRQKFPERFIQIGVAEQNLATIASGMAAMGKVPFISSYAMFSPGRNWEQIRTTICYNNQNVKIIGSHAGVSVGPDGATHQAIEDIAITRVIPNITIIAPCDINEAKKATIAIAEHTGPVYMRLQREKTPVFTTDKTPFELGKANILYDSSDGNPDIAIIACGALVHNALLVAYELEKKGISIRVINNHTIKPMDEKTIIEAAKDARAIVTVEEHQVHGGMGSRVAEIIAQNYPVPIEFIGVHNRFGESGEPNELVEYFGMGVSHIKEAVKKVLGRKK